MTITPINGLRGHSQESTRASVDIVAVHDIFEDDIETWTEPRSKVFWLRDLLSKRLPDGRVLTYSYQAESFTSPGVDSSASILAHAQNLVAELYAHRHLENASSRPIIFICHGFGGLLIKRALAFSHSRTKPNVHHLKSIYTCTCGILFFGTPHAGIHDKAIFLRQTEASGPNQFMLNLTAGSEILDEINDQFAPLMARFFIFNFWESLKTEHAGHPFYVVDQESAAPAWDDVEKCGLMATHSGMTKFDGLTDRRFQVIIEALSRYARAAAGLIETRIRQEAELTNRRRQLEVDEIVQSQLHRSPHANDSPPDYNRWSLIPRKSSTFFTGRQKHAHDVKQMLGDIRRYDTRGRTRTLVIYGLGGSGKTQFCLKYAEDNKHKYWGVFWVDASSEKSLESSFAFIGTQLGRGPSTASAIHWLSQCKDPWLLIIDNIDDPDADLSSYFPREGNGHILITTRNPNAVEHSNAGHLRFRGMEPRDAIDLLLKAAYPGPLPNLLPTTPGRRQLAEGVAVELGYLPLAITHAGAAIRRNIYTLERYLKHYLLQRKNMLSHTRVKSVDEVNIITTWEIPFQRIVSRASAEHRDAVDLMHTFAFMHHESIPEHIFQRSWHDFNSADPAFGDYPDILQAVWNEDAQARLRRAIRVLCDHSIIEYDPSEGTCNMHPVVHNWARERLDLEAQKKWLHCTMAILAHCISTEMEASRRSFRALLLPHIGSCLRFYESQPNIEDTVRSATEMNSFAKVYAEHGFWVRARKLQERVVATRQKLLGRSHKDTVNARISKAQSHWNLFEVKEAIDEQREILDLLRWRRPNLAEWIIWPFWEPIHISYCNALGEITQSLWLAGERGWSEHCGKRAVNGLTRRLGDVDPQTLKAMFHLARTYFHVGKEEESRQLLLWVLKLQKRFFGMNHPDTLMTRNELGMLLCARKKHLRAAMILVENVLKARKRILGEEHAYTLWSVNDLSKIYVELGRPQEAATMLEDIVPIVKRTLGDDHVGMALTRSNLGKAYSMSERWEDAEKIISRTLGAIDAKHPDALHNKYGYAQILYNLGRLEEAATYCEEILRIVMEEQIIPLDDTRTIASADLLAQIYRHQGQHEKAERLRNQIPGLGLALSRDRFDPYAVRRGSSQQTPKLDLISRTAPQQNVSSREPRSHAEARRDVDELENRPRLSVRHTF